MSKSVIPFTNDAFGEIRVLGDWENPLFCLSDVCKALELGNPSQVKKRLDKGVISNETLQTAGGKQKMVFVNEDGLYDVVLDSRKPEARNFRKWITSEVLPTIRKTGAYVLSKAEKELLEARRDSKLYRHEETDAIKLFIEYARLQGCDWDEKYIYSQITIMCNLAVGFPMKGGRNFATKIQLKAIAVLEGLTVKNTLLSGIAQGLDWKEIWAQIRLQIIAFQEVNFPAESNIPLIGS